MAEDNRTLAEGSPSWNLQGGMGLHLRGRGLQPSPYEESGDSSDLSRGRSVLAGPKMKSAGRQRMQPEPFPNHKITETGENLTRGVHFFRSLLGDAGLLQADRG